MAARASDKHGKYRETYSAGYGTCAAYLLAVNECNHSHCRDLNAFSDWLMGYITAYNTGTPDTFDIVAHANLKSTLEWLAQYCRKNPQQSFSQATAKLMLKLSPSREKLRPKDWIEK
jgi:hypothetical protein